MENAISDIYRNVSPPNGFVTTTAALPREENEKFRKGYLHRLFCPMVAIDLKEFKKECYFDLSPWLKPYESFISISTPYTPNIVRLFYYMMEYDNELGDYGEVIEERVTTVVRNVKFTLFAAILNKILRIDNPLPIPEFSYNNQEVFETLRPGEPFPPDQQLRLTFRPSSMPPENRVLWYVYSRNFIPKGGNYTHFTQHDYRPFTAFVQKKPFNLGLWLLKGMTEFKFAKRQLSHIPYPSLISVILFYNKIWYVGTFDTLEYPPFFGKTQMNLMKI